MDWKYDKSWPGVWLQHHPLPTAVWVLGTVWTFTLSRDTHACTCIMYIRHASPAKAGSAILDQIPDWRGHYGTEEKVLHLGYYQKQLEAYLLFMRYFWPVNWMILFFRGQSQWRAPALSVLLQAPPLIVPGCLIQRIKDAHVTRAPWEKSGRNRTPKGTASFTVARFLDKLLETEPRSHGSLGEAESESRTSKSWTSVSSLMGPQFIHF